MKPASIIFSIISVLVIIGGLFMCTTAMDMADEQGIALFDTDVKEIGENTVRTDTVSGKELNKIKINVGDVDVILAASKTGETYVELYNFQVGTYDYSTQNKMLHIDNAAGFLSILNLENASFRFDGLRSYLMYRPMRDKQQSVYVYLAEKDAKEIKNIEITAKNGDVFIRDLAISSDYNISLTSGTVWMSNIDTTSRVSVSIDKGNLTMNSVTLQSASILIGEGGCDLYLKNMPQNTELEVFKGDIHLAFDAEISPDYILTAKASEMLYFNGEAQAEKTYSVDNADLTVAKCKATATSGSLYLTMNATDIAHAFSGSYVPAEGEDTTVADTAE